MNTVRVCTGDTLYGKPLLERIDAKERMVGVQD